MRNIIATSLIVIMFATGCGTVVPKPGDRVRTSGNKVPLPPWPGTNAPVIVPRPEYVTVPSLAKASPKLLAPVKKAGNNLIAPSSLVGGSAIGGPNHFAAQWLDGPTMAFSGDQITVDAHMKNLCDFGDTMELRWVSLSIQHYPSGIIDDVPNIVTTPLTMVTGQTVTVSYTVPTRQGDTFLLIYADIRGVDLVNGAIESVMGHQIKIEAPLAIRIENNAAVVRFRTSPTKVTTLETSTNFVAGSTWIVAETIPPMPPNTMVERTYLLVGPKRFFRTVQTNP